MDRVMCTGTLCAMIFFLSGSFSISQPEDINLERLMKGDILVNKISDEDNFPGIQAKFIMRATRSELWGMLTDYDNFPLIYGGIDSLRVISENKDSVLVQIHQTTLFKKIQFVLQRNYLEPGYNLSWESISGDLEMIKGSWEIHDTQDQDIKLVIYTSFFRYGGMVPSKIVRSWAMGQVRKMAENSRRWIEENRRLYSGDISLIIDYYRNYYFYLV